MDPLTLLAAGTAYVVSEFLKKGVGSAIDGTYNKVVSFFKRKLGHDLQPTDLESGNLRSRHLDQDPEATALTREFVNLSSALGRARLVAPVLSGASVLWVDDLPNNNEYESRMLRCFGVEVDQVRSTEGAFAKLQGRSYDLILSDMARDGLADAGVRFLAQLRAGGNATPVVFYVGKVDESRGVPRGAFGIADGPEPLLHLVFDVREIQARLTAQRAALKPILPEAQS